MLSISLVIPVFNEEASLAELYRRVTAVMNQRHTPYELIFVNDCSTDQSLTLLREIAMHDEQVKLLTFSRNFGHQMAITAGLDYSQGDAVVVMDADLQDPPEVLPELMAKWQEGYDVVYAVRTTREGENVFKRSTASVFYRLLKRLSGVEIPVDAGDFRLMSRRAVTALGTLRERHRFVRGLSSWIGFRQASISYTRAARYAGETKYPWRKMLTFACDGIASFSFAPLRIATYLGLSASFVSFLYILYALWIKFFTDRSVVGWASLVVAVLFIGGVQLLTLGIIGEYIGRMYEESKQRPLYIVADTVGFSSATQDTTLTVKQAVQPMCTNLFSPARNGHA